MIDSISKEGDNMAGKEVRERIDKNEVVAYWTECGGVEVYDIEYTPDGIMFYVKANTLTSKPTYHRTKVIEKYTVDGAHDDHIRIYNKRLYLKDCLRTGLWR